MATTFRILHAPEDAARAQDLARALGRQGHEVQAPQDVDDGRATLVALWSQAAGPMMEPRLPAMIEAWAEGRLVLVALDGTPPPLGLRDERLVRLGADAAGAAADISERARNRAMPQPGAAAPAGPAPEPRASAIPPPAARRGLAWGLAALVGLGGAVAAGMLMLTFEGPAPARIEPPSVATSAPAVPAPAAPDPAGIAAAVQRVQALSAEMDDLEARLADQQAALEAARVAGDPAVLARSLDLARQQDAAAQQEKTDALGALARSVRADPALVARIPERAARELPLEPAQPPLRGTSDALRSAPGPAGSPDSRDTARPEIAPADAARTAIAPPDLARRVEVIEPSRRALGAIEEAERTRTQVEALESAMRLQAEAPDPAMLEALRADLETRRIARRAELVTIADAARIDPVLLGTLPPEVVVELPPEVTASPDAPQPAAPTITGEVAVPEPGDTGGPLATPAPAQPGGSDWLALWPIGLALVGGVVVTMVVVGLVRRGARAAAAGAGEPAGLRPGAKNAEGPAPIGAPAGAQLDPRTLFISYSHRDRAQVLPLVERIEAMGHPVWMDREGLTGGPGWGVQIVRAIKASRAVVLMASNRSYGSDHVVREMYLAMNHRKPIVPIELERADLPEELEYIIAQYQRHDVTEGPDEALARALAGLPSG